jgi:hypothetical protein
MKWIYWTLLFLPLAAFAQLPVPLTPDWLKGGDKEAGVLHSTQVQLLGNNYRVLQTNLVAKSAASNCSASLPSNLHPTFLRCRVSIARRKFEERQTAGAGQCRLRKRRVECDSLLVAEDQSPRGPGRVHGFAGSNDGGIDACAGAPALSHVT